MVVKPGLAFWRNGHPWIILTDPIPASGMIICVNLTTFDSECEDDACILSSSDYAWIKHPTAVAFSYARMWDVQKVDAELTSGMLRLAKPPEVPAKTLAKIRQAALTALDVAMKKLL